MPDRDPTDDLSLRQLQDYPYALLAELRAERPVAWVPAIGGWLITSRADALEVMRDADRFTVDDPRFSTSRVVGPSMLSLDGSRHQRHRRPFAEPFKRSAVANEFRTWLPEESRRLVAALRPKGRAELRTELAGPLAGSVITRALGLVDVDQQELLGWYRAIVDAVTTVTEGEDVPMAGHAALADLRAAVLRTAEVPSSLLHAIANSSDLTDAELVSNTAVMLFGAIETSEGATANVLFHLLEHPDQLHRIRMDPELIDAAVEESLRLEPAATVIDRYVVDDTALGGRQLRTGDLVRVSLLAANRDPAEFDDPDHFAPGRANVAKHLTFAQGPHACLGLHLARAEAVEAVRAVVGGLPDLQLVAGATDAPSGLVFRKPGRVTATWTPT